jgi:hypothetical protein
MVSQKPKIESSETISIRRLAELKESGLIVRNSTAVIKQWPWENGIPLQHGSMADTMKDALLDSIHDRELINMVLVCL